MFPADLIQDAEALSRLLRDRNLVLASAESCTGGLIAGLITELAGSSEVFDRGFVTYSNEAKHDMLAVPNAMLQEFGAVSEPVARAMAAGAIANSNASVSIAVTGIAGPGGGSDTKPVGLVHIAGQHRDAFDHRKCLFGDIGRDAIRIATIKTALEIITNLVTANRN